MEVICYNQASQMKEITSVLQTRIDNLKILERHLFELDDENNTWLCPIYNKRLALSNAKNNSIALLNAIKDLPNNSIIIAQTADEIIEKKKENEKRREEYYERIIDETFDVMLAWHSIQPKFYVYSHPYTYTEQECMIILHQKTGTQFSHLNNEKEQIFNLLKLRIENLTLLEKHNDELSDENNTWLCPIYTKRLAFPNAKKNSMTLICALEKLPKKSRIYAQTQKEIMQKRNNNQYQHIVSERVDILLKNKDTDEYFVYSEPYGYTEKEMQILSRERKLI